MRHYGISSSMEVANISGNYYPYTIPFEREMERQTIQEFIEIYKSEPSLWKVRSCNYNNKAVKNLAYRRMVSKLRELYSNADVELVKKKINALRTNYRKELRKVETSKDRNRQTGEPVYVPSLWYYELFHFIADQESEPAGNEMQENIDMQEILHVDLDENVQFEGDESDETYDEEFQVSSPESARNEDQNSSRQKAIDTRQPVMLSEPPSYKRKRNCSYKAEDEWYAAPEAPRQLPVADGHEIFGRYVASKLRKMDKPMQMLSERLISEVLFRGQMGLLNKTSTIVDNDVPAAVKVE